MKNATDALLAVVTAVGVAVAGAACTEGSGVSEEAKRAPESQPQATDAGTRGDREKVAEPTTAEFRVDGMTCGGCAVATEMAVEKLDGVESADAEYRGGEKSGRCTVTYDPSVVSTDAIASAIEAAGYSPTLVEGPSSDRRPVGS